METNLNSNTEPITGNYGLESVAIEAGELIRTLDPEFQIDPQYSSLPPLEAIKRTAQSKSDSIKSKVTNLEKENAGLTNMANFWEEFTTNPEMKMAVIAQYAPELFKPKSMLEQVKAKLKEEFNEDLWFNTQQINEDADGKAWFWNQRREHWMKELSANGSNGKVKKLDDLIKERQALNTAKESERVNKINALKKEKNLSDDAFNVFLNWTKRLNDLNMLYSIFEFSMRNNIPIGPSMISSNLAPQNKKEMVDRLNNIFGNTQ